MPCRTTAKLAALAFTGAFAGAVPASISAQTTSYVTNNPAPIKGDPNKIVCEKQEKIGTRLGGEKVCLTVAEWQARKAADRDQMERVQSGARAPCAEDPTCNRPMGPARPHR